MKIGRKFYLCHNHETRYLLGCWCSKLVYAESQEMSLGSNQEGILYKKLDIKEMNPILMLIMLMMMKIGDPPQIAYEIRFSSCRINNHEMS